MQLPLLLFLLTLASQSLARRHASPPTTTETLDITAFLSISSTTPPLPPPPPARLRRRTPPSSARGGQHGTRVPLLRPNTHLLRLRRGPPARPVVFGVGQGSGEYFSRIGIGSPARQLCMVLDTGSEVTWLQCAPCADCYAQSVPLCDPSLSSSYAAAPCDFPRCRALDASACHSSCVYEVAYGDGYTVADFAMETLTLGNDGSAAVHDVAIGGVHENEGLFVGAAGLLALDGGPLSFPSQISATDFSCCLVDRDSPSASTLQFGLSPSDDSTNSGFSSSMPNQLGSGSGSGSATVDSLGQRGANVDMT
ncbi:hypothetical protein BRADI_2g24998v3 [Brachypodium distachyon]|uniref:Peptidase A1 domain-containing protein n=1 Tax=Brachypodium distachyon TaxID=15368 RepID=A0A0Q3G4H7_BRADI|nr:hypothetical protein BRADI_2g24998v3 [Brachypodium distachyon]